MRFGSKDGLDCARRAPEPARYRIGVHLKRFHIRIVDAIWPGSTGAADAGAPGLHPRIRAGAMYGLEIGRHDAAGALHAITHIDHRIMVRIGGGELFGVSHDDFYRTLRPLREEISDGQLAGAALAAEVAADVHRIDANLAGRDAYGLGKLRAGAERSLRR